MKSNGKTIAIVGATGAVGEVLLQVLEERQFPVGELRPLASERSAGTTVHFNGRDLPVELARPEAFNPNLAGSLTNLATVQRDRGDFARRGAVAIDKSGTWRMTPSVPLVIPEVNPQALAAHSGHRLVSNCTTIGFVFSSSRSVAPPGSSRWWSRPCRR
jgi:aspartate-semialdehyde dehydrogenase